MNQFYTERQSCRICDSRDLTDLFSLGMHYINAFPATIDTSLPQAPIELMLCNHCSVVQLRHTARQELLYSGEYFYQSSVSSTMRRNLQDLVWDIEQCLPLSAGDVVLDIGANDGYMLGQYSVDGITKVGVEPASNLAELCREKCDVFIPGFWGFDSYWQAVGKKAKVISAIGMFYDTDQPNEFIEDVAKSLDFNGVFVAQLMCLRNMIEMNDVGNLAHEHLLFYSLKSLHYLFNRHGLEIFDIELNDVNGESYRIWARHIGSTVKARTGALRRMATMEYRDRGLDDPKLYRDFYDEMNRNRDEVRAFVASENDQGRSVWIRGASTKGNTLAQFFEMDNGNVAGASDAAPWKHGKRMVGSWIPIHSPEFARHCASTFVILPFAFKQEIMQQESEWFKSGGKKFCVPLPRMQVIE